MTVEEFLVFRRKELASFFRNMWGRHWVRMAGKHFGVGPAACYRLGDVASGRSRREQSRSGYYVCTKWESWARRLGFTSPLDNWLAKGLGEEEKRIVELALAKTITRNKQAEALRKLGKGAPAKDALAAVAEALGK